MARFDWYQATVQASPGQLIEALGGISAVGRWEHCKQAPNGYESAQRLVDEDGTLCSVWWGSRHQWPHAIATGETAPALAEVLRTEYGGKHGVARADVCIDYAEEGAYDRLQSAGLVVAGHRGVKVGTAGDHLLTKEARAVYFGGKLSSTRVVMYDKAAELRAKFHNNLSKLLQVPDHLARLEVRVRPQGWTAKAAVAAADPVSIMGSSAWTRELLREVAGLDLEPLNVRAVWRQSDDERAYRAVLAQYGAVFARRAQTLGSWECVGLQLGDDLAENTRLRASIRRS